MHPILLRIGPLPIRSYGVLIAAAFALGIWLAVRRARGRGVDSARMVDLSIAILVAAIIGSRFLFVLPYHEEFLLRPWRILFVWEGGLSMFGGLLAAIVAAVVYMRIKKMPFWLVSDLCAPSVALGLGITRIGCFLNGCCFGLPTTHAWGVCFPPHSAAGAEFYGVAIHPTQLYASAAGFALFGVLLLVEKPLHKVQGRLFLLFLVLYGITRFLLDRLRYFESVSTISWGGTALSWSQLLSLVLVLAGALLFWYRGRRS